MVILIDKRLLYFYNIQAAIYARVAELADAHV